MLENTVSVPHYNENCTSRLPCGVCLILGRVCPKDSGMEITWQGPTCNTVTTNTLQYERVEKDDTEWTS